MISAYLMKPNLLRVEADSEFHGGQVFDYSLLMDQTPQKMILTNSSNGAYYFEVEYQFGKEYKLKINNGFDVLIHLDEVTRSSQFDELFHYEGPLGPQYDPLQTTFLVWAPTATELHALLDDYTESHVIFSRKERGLWSATVKGDLHKISYRLLVKVNGTWNETTDPYALMSIHESTRSVVVDKEKIKVDLNNSVPKKRKNPLETVLYELHVRDYSIFGRQKTKGKFISFLEETDHDLRYIKNLGITHVQLLPVYDFGSVYENHEHFYNWGYDPVDLNTVEGSYATLPNGIEKLIEFKQMIQAMHGHGLRVVMDVVFNHVFIREQHVLEKLVPGYYFRFKGKQPSNGSFCGNDFESNRSMGRRYIIDVCKRYVTEYGIDGFRFDLMGITDAETMNLLRAELDQLDPTLLLYGEGWNMMNTLADHSKLATIQNHYLIPRIQMFNDLFRDSLRQLTNYEGIRRVLTKHCTYLPFKQSVNYVECHDNETLFDYVDGDFKRHQLLTTLALLAPGIPFLHAGQEFYRSKKGVENSYCSPDDINGLDWLRAESYSGYQTYIKNLLAFRKAHPALTNPEAFVEMKIEHGLDKYTFTFEEDTVMLIVNMNDTIIDHPFNYRFYSDDLTENDNKKAIEPFSCMVLS